MYIWNSSHMHIYTCVYTYIYIYGYISDGGYDDDDDYGSPSGSIPYLFFSGQFSIENGQFRPFCP